MGKSPGKWLKTLLFRKKSTRSNYAKAKDNLVTNEKGQLNSAKEPLADLAVNSTLVSQPVPTKNDVNSSNVEAETTASAEAGTIVAVHKDVQTADASVGTGVSHDPEKIREEQAAIKAQAAFRGYLARRAFQALKGIIKLQALVRGHLVRRQAVVTLLCLQSIIKLQAAFRGQRVRASDLGQQAIHQKLDARKTVSTRVSGTVKGLSSRTDRLLSNAFVKKLLVSSPTVKPLQLFYVESGPNSAWSWLERWTAFRFTFPAVQSKKRGDPKLHKHTMSRTVENEANKLKRNTRTRSIAHGEPVVTSTAHESERSKRTLKKMPAHVDSPQEPQSELEKVKRNLRKVTLNAITDIASDHQEMETEKVKRNVNLRKPSSSTTELHDNGEADFADKSSKESPISCAEQPQLKVVCEPIVANSLVDCPQIDKSVEQKTNEVSEPVAPPESVIISESLSAVNGELSSPPKEDQVCIDNQKASKRRSSSQENGLHSCPTLPSYMAATESAKAKLRCQGSPRLSSDGMEGNGVTRRHSLPSVSNGKVSSLSPRMQRLVQSNGKGSIRDRSLQSSRDGNDKVVQPEWRR